MSSKVNTTATAARYHSINAGFKLREDMRIHNENIRLLKRLQGQTSVYNYVEWRRDESKRKKLLKNISTFKPSAIFQKPPNVNIHNIKVYKNLDKVK